MIPKYTENKHGELRKFWKKMQWGRLALLILQETERASKIRTVSYWQINKHPWRKPRNVCRYVINVATQKEESGPVNICCGNSLYAIMTDFYLVEFQRDQRLNCWRWDLKVPEENMCEFFYTLGMEKAFCYSDVKSQEPQKKSLVTLTTVKWKMCAGKSTKVQWQT